MTYRVVRKNEQGLEMRYVTSHRGNSERVPTSTVTREGQTAERDDKNINCLQRLSLLLINLLSYSHGLFAFVGSVVECTLNFLAENGCFWTLWRCIFHRDELVFPKEGESNYHTLIWQLDPRTKLYTDTSASAKARSTETDTDSFPVEGTGSRRTLDVTIMASKLVYENENVVKKVVEEIWNMKFVKFYTCWNEYNHRDSTVAFIFADLEYKAIFLVWRGTEPFNTWDWSTDIDFSFAKFENGMAVHVGFLEALGLCHRDDVNSFIKMDNNAQDKRNRHTDSTSGLPDEIKNSKILAYDYITREVAELLSTHQQARLFVTGHSLGGALAAVYGAMLYYNGETEITNRLAAIYTFGQPRVGNKAFADYANCKLGCRYKRVVYCNDIIPRILDEQPEINIFGAHITAFFELIQCAVILPCRHGCEYMESAVSFLAGLAGIFEPGVIAHSPRNYVNAVRLGPCRLSRKTPRNSLSSVCFILRALVVSFLGCLCAMFMGF